MKLFRFIFALFTIFFTGLINFGNSIFGENQMNVEHVINIPVYEIIEPTVYYNSGRRGKLKMSAISHM